MFLKKKTNQQKKEFVEHHFIFIEVPVELVAPQALLWSQSGWWPESSLQYVAASLNFQQGTQVQKKISLLMGPRWELEVTKLTDYEIEWTYRKGIIKGVESLRVEGRSNGTRIDYELRGSIKGLFPKILWMFYFKKVHARSLQKILTALKASVIAKYDSLRTRHEEGN